MNKETIHTAAPGIIAIAVLLLSLVIPVSVAALAGFGTIAMLLAIAGLEYTRSKKRPLIR